MAYQVTYSYGQEQMLKNVYNEIQSGRELNIVECDSLNYIEKNSRHSLLVNYLDEKGVVFHVNKNSSGKINRNGMRVYEEEHIIYLDLKGRFVYILPDTEKNRTVYYNWALRIFNKVDIVGDFGLIRIDIGFLK